MQKLIAGVLIGCAMLIATPSSAQQRFQERYEDNTRFSRSLDGFRPVPERYDLHYGPGGYFGSGVRPSRPPPGPPLRRCAHVLRGVDRNTNMPIYVQECG